MNAGITAVRFRSLSGYRVSRRYPLLVDILRDLPVRSAIIATARSWPVMPAAYRDFWRLFSRSSQRADLRVWAFDLLALNRKDLRRWSLESRQNRPEAVVSRFGCPALWPRDGQALLQEKHGLEGIRCVPPVVQDQNDGLT